MNSPKKKSGLVISNCQCQPIAHYLSLYCKNIVFKQFGVHELAGADLIQKTSSILADRQQFSVIISINLSDSFGDLSESKLKSAFSEQPVYTIPNFYFEGFHPDITYIGGLNRRVKNTIGDYHSRIAFAGYLSGLSPQECTSLFCDETYERCGFYNVYTQSLSQFRKRNEQLDIPFADEMATLLTNTLCFYTVNHPSATLLGEFTKKISERLHKDGVCEKSGWPSHPDYLPDHLGMRSTFPIYPEIARRFGQSELGCYLFKSGLTGNVPSSPFSLEEFVETEFSAFSEFTRQQLLETPQAKAIAKQFAFLFKGNIDKEASM